MSTVGLDVGTSRVKAVRFDEDWRETDTETETTIVSRGASGRSEQHMPAVRDAALRVLRAVVARSPHRVQLVAVTAQGDGTWLVDAQGQPIAPAMLWNDNRASGIVSRWQADGTAEAAFRISGNLVAPGLAAAQLAWLVAEDPAVLDRATRLLSCGSWIFAALTGCEVLDVTEAANPFLDAGTQSYDDRLLDLFGIGHLRRLLPPVVSGVERRGELLSAVSEAVGLRSGTPVVLAPYDVVSTSIGTGTVAPGEAFAVLGTTLCIGSVSDTPRLERRPSGMTLPIAPDRWLLAEATMIGTEVLDWAASLLGVAGASDLVALADTSTHLRPPLLLPYLSPTGERSPFLDPDARGALVGLDITHQSADVARAVVDGLSIAVRDCLAGTDTAPRQLALSGGGARSRAWCQAIADATGLPVALPDVTEVGARGAVLAAATTVGWFPDVDAAVAVAVSPGELVKPDPARVGRLAATYQETLHTRRKLLGH